jgi:hypothetical protein
VVIAQFTPRFIFENELATYGLPSPTQACEIMGLIDMASVAIDEYCGRIDGDGNGSLVYTTYTQRCLLQTRNRNLVEIPMKPVAVVTPDVSAALQAQAETSGASGNYWFTGVLPNTLTSFTKDLSGIIGCSGRYGYTRQDLSSGYPDLFATINPLTILALFGGPAPWIPVDVTQIDYDNRTGEAWIPVGLQLQRYSEILITYNSGFDPNRIHPLIKRVTSSLVKNAMAMGNATTALRGLTVAKSGVNYHLYGDLFDPTLDRMLTPFKNVRGI